MTILTKTLADFTAMPYTVAPISGFTNPPGALDMGKMIVEDRLAIADDADPDFPLGLALWNEVLGPAYEVFATLGPLDSEGYFGGLVLLNEAGTGGYALTWVSTGSQTGVILMTFPGRITLRSWQVDNFSTGDMVRFVAKNNQITSYLKYGSNPWQTLGTVKNIILPVSGRIGFGVIE